METQKHSTPCRLFCPGLSHCISTSLSTELHPEIFSHSWDICTHRWSWKRCFTPGFLTSDAGFPSASCKGHKCPWPWQPRAGWLLCCQWPRLPRPPPAVAHCWTAQGQSAHTFGAGPVMSLGCTHKNLALKYWKQCYFLLTSLKSWWFQAPRDI